MLRPYRGRKVVEQLIANLLNNIASFLPLLVHMMEM